MTKYVYEPLAEIPKVRDILVYNGSDDVGLTKGHEYEITHVKHPFFYFINDEGDEQGHNFAGSHSWLIRRPAKRDSKYFEDEMASIAKVNANLTKPDNVNSPAHYTAGNIETIDIIEQTISGLPPERAYALGNVIKYISRHTFKNGKEDLEKAAWYLNRAIEQYDTTSK